jgi:flagellar basal body-associated protein FliL
MNFHNPKMKKILAIIIIVVIAAMVVTSVLPMFMS